jgi:hypothetical protein
MKPTLIMPIHDPAGLVLPRFADYLPVLDPRIDALHLDLSASTAAAQANVTARLQAAPNVRLSISANDRLEGRLLNFYRQTACLCPAEQTLHLCFPDRVIFALSTPEHRQTFLDDLCAAVNLPGPRLYHRSEKAWQTHPRVYRELESWITRLGELLYGRSLDFAWCHFAIQAADLNEILAHAQTDGLPLLAEIVRLTVERVQVQEVDWLAWEDPYIFGRDPDELRQERETDSLDLYKRLGYVLPMLEVLKSNTISS